MAEAGKTHGQPGLQARRHVQHHHQVDAGIDFGVVVGALWHAPQPVNFGQQLLERTTGAQHLKHARRRVLHQATRQLLPDPLGHQRIGLAARYHFAHQRQGFRRYCEVRKTRSKTRDPQDAHRVFAEGVGDMAQHFGLQIAVPAPGIDQDFIVYIKWAFSPYQTVLNSYGIDSEVAPCQVFFERYTGGRVDLKTAVAACGFALGACQRVLLPRLGMKKDRKVLADRQKTLGHQFFGACAYHHPITVLHGQAEQGITYSTADHVDVHGASVGAARA